MVVGDTSSYILIYKFNPPSTLDYLYYLIFKYTFNYPVTCEVIKLLRFIPTGLITFQYCIQKCREYVLLKNMMS